MKKYIYTFVFTLCILGVTGQAPDRISYQAVIRDLNQNLIANRPVTIRLTIMLGHSPGTSVYREMHSVTSNKNGLVTLLIGGGTVLSGSLSAINWSNGSYYLKTETDITGGTNFTIVNTNQLISVPYAIYANTAGTCTENDPFFTTSVASGITASDTAKWNQTAASETDPVFVAWDKSTGISITESQISNLQPYLLTETDPQFNASVAKGITGADTTSWNAKIAVETDPLYTAWDKSTGISITESQISNLQPYLLTETDPVFANSVAGGITSVDTAKWNNMTCNETDPVFANSVAGGITSIDTAKWNNMTCNETDPVFSSSIAGSITSVDTAKWNNMTIAENDPVFVAWDKSTGISITESQISNLQPYLLTETDPQFNASVAKGITGADTASWNAKIAVETDPLYTAWDKSTGISITESQISNLQPYLLTETDPQFNASVAKGITSADTASWNAKVAMETDPLYTAWDKSTGISITESQISNLQPYLLTETDPVFANSVAGGITSIDTAKWNNMTCNETDPVFANSVASSITSVDTANWNNMTCNETDPVFTNSVAGGITSTDTANWNNKAMVGGSNPGEMMYWNGSVWMLVPTGSYGQSLVFCNGVPTWGGCPPVVNTGNISGITGSSAIIDGDVVNDGGTFVSERGICWATIASPTISGNHLTGGSGTGSYQLTLTGLSNSTTYYARAYATNSAGTFYGNEVSFTTTTVVVLPPQCSFSGNPTSVQVNASVQFTDLSTNTPTTWLWDFGDGNGSVAPNPTHIYSTPGVYSVSLTVANVGGSDVLLKQNYITVTNVPITGQPCPGMVTVTDIDGNVYNSVQIGNQCWLQQNLKTTRFNNGTAIPIVPDNLTWSMSLTPAMCWYNNDSASYHQTYGVLYNWYAVNTGNLCPVGWHEATTDEWDTLANYVGGIPGPLKEIGLAHWATPNSGATNITGFTALPGGGRAANSGTFANMFFHGEFWTSTAYTTTNAIAYGVHYDHNILYRDTTIMRNGCSVRCVAD